MNSWPPALGGWPEKRSDVLNRRIALNVINFLILFVCFLDLGCGRPAEPELDRAVENFHAQFRSGNYPEIYRGASGYLHSSTTEEKFVKLLRKIDQELGPVESIEPQGNVAKLTLRGMRWTLVFLVKFRKDSGVERLIFVREDGIIKLAGYGLNSPTLTPAQP